jgi:hypothetical protein
VEETTRWLDEWVYSVSDRTAYLARLGADTLARLKPGIAMAEPINYGSYS